MEERIVLIYHKKPDIVLTNLVLDITIVGSSINNLYGDCTGFIQCAATVTNAVKFDFKFGDNIVKQITNGTSQYTFTTVDTITY